jgi:hypothetical protein
MWNTQRNNRITLTMKNVRPFQFIFHIIPPFDTVCICQTVVKSRKLLKNKYWIKRNAPEFSVLTIFFFFPSLLYSAFLYSHIFVFTFFWAIHTVTLSLESVLVEVACIFASYRFKDSLFSTLWSWIALSGLSVFYEGPFGLQFYRA